MVDKDTELFISVSSQPGFLGARVYAYLFAHYNKNAVYLPRVAPETATDLVLALRTLGVSGCSVSMPLKSAVLPLLDWVAPDALAMHSVNTIVRDGGRLCGFNTDYLGVVGALSGRSVKNALVYGTGGVVGAVIYALQQLGVGDITISGRSSSRAQQIADRYQSGWADTRDLDRKFDLVINATPAQEVEDLHAPISHSKVFFDLQPQGDKALIEFAAGHGVEVVRGLAMYRSQVRYQFQHYTNILPSDELIAVALTAASRG